MDASTKAVYTMEYAYVFCALFSIGYITTLDNVIFCVMNVLFIGQ